MNKPYWWEPGSCKAATTKSPNSSWNQAFDFKDWQIQSSFPSLLTGAEELLETTSKNNSSTHVPFNKSQL